MDTWATNWRFIIYLIEWFKSHKSILIMVQTVRIYRFFARNLLIATWVLPNFFFCFHMEVTKQETNNYIDLYTIKTLVETYHETQSYHWVKPFLLLVIMADWTQRRMLLAGRLFKKRSTNAAPTNWQPQNLHSELKQPGGTHQDASAGFNGPSCKSVFHLLVTLIRLDGIRQQSWVE